MKIREDDQNPNTLRNFSSYKIGFLKSSSKRSKNTGGGVQGRLEKFQTEAEFFRVWLPLVTAVGLFFFSSLEPAFD